MENNQQVIKVSEDELGIKRAYKEAIEARKKGVKLAFDLTHIKDGKTKVEIIKLMNSIQ